MNITNVKSKLKKQKSKKEEAKVPEETPSSSTPVRRAKKKSSFVDIESTKELPPAKEPQEEIKPQEKVLPELVEEKIDEETMSPLPKTLETPVETVSETSEVAEVVETAPEEKTEDIVKEEKAESPLPESPTPPSKVDEIQKNTEEKKNPSNTSSPQGKKSKGKDSRNKKQDRSQQPSLSKAFNSRDRRGLESSSGDEVWRKKKRFSSKGSSIHAPEPVIRPNELKIRLPISIKDLASQMKLKSSQLISKLFMQGIALTLNDLLDDETTTQLLGHEFDCEITIDSSEEERIRITSESIKEEVLASPSEQLVSRSPVIAFMGHVDHGKTTIIDAIRKTNYAASEAGAITQHIGAFRYVSSEGEALTILDTPGHEAFSAMRARGAEVTDLIVLVVAGDEGFRQQTIEAIQHARAANVPMLVAINKSDKSGFNAENIYRQLSDNNLLPEAWGGTTITVNCSAITGDGIPELLEMLILQTEFLELKANPTFRARGSILESEMHKGLGAVATVLIQNGTLKKGDAIVLGNFWGRVKTMKNELNQEVLKAEPSIPVEITGISGVPEAGDEFIVVQNEKEARNIAKARMEEDLGYKMNQKKKNMSIENLLQKSETTQKKILNLVLRADMQGSLEALKAALLGIESDKIEANIVFAGPGEISESDIQLAAASKAIIVGFHTAIESHAEALVKQLSVKVFLHNIIYHAVDEIKNFMTGMLNKIVKEEDTGSLEVRATFKVSKIGVIAGCFVKEGTIKRNHKIRVVRDGENIWKGDIQSIKREKDDAREVSKGVECGIFLDGFNDIHEGDILEAFEIIHLNQEL